MFQDTSLVNSLSETELKFSYRRFPSSFHKKFRNLDIELSEKRDKAMYIGYDYTSSSIQDDLWDDRSIDYDGSFARGLSLGNSQSLLLNSNFNMQMSGNIGEGIQIKAAISDDNIPIQPEGNTRLLQEFDKVFINVSKNRSSITAGDYELRRPNSYFINYLKQVQGLSAYHEMQLSDNQRLSQKMSFAISRAKFNRVLISVVEGNQGPYKLPGANGERFIIIEAGSEKVYEDGRLLTRGQNHDYLINYDRAELSFTEKKLITKDSRITVEYEYVDRNYLRTMYAGESIYSFNKWDFRFNFYSQQDSRNVTGDRPLDSLDLDILSQGGDDLQDTRRWGGRLVEDAFDNSLITYSLSVDSILTYNIDQSVPLYTAVFTEVEAGLGTYIIDSQVNANGRVYIYVGMGMGNYIPEIQLVAPQQNQIISLGSTYRLSDQTFIEGEFSLSNNNLNRFSSLDSEDDIGIATYFKVNHEIQLGKDSLTFLTPFIALEYTQQNFKALNPYRAVEFTRDWNLEALRTKTDERILKSGFRLNRSKFIDLEYGLQAFNRKENYDGLLHTLNYRIEYKGFEFTSLSSLLFSQTLEENSTFLRPILGISRKLGGDNPWKIGYVYEAEKNDRLDPLFDLFNPLSASWRVHQYFIESPKSEKLQGSIRYEHRLDKAIENNVYNDFSDANDFILSARWQSSKTSALNIDFTFRDLGILDQTLATAKNVQARKSYLGQIDYTFNLLSGFLKSTSSFNIGSGQQAKVEYDYQEVLPGEGSYDWIDINEDGVQQLAEFRLSEFQDTSRFIQVPLFNNEFLQTNNSGINQSLRLDFKNLFKTKKTKEKDAVKNAMVKELSKWKKAIKPLSILSTIRVNKKIEVDASDYNPFDLSFDDTRIVNFNSFINHTLYVNRGNPKWDSQLGFKGNRTKFVQISGFEGRGLEEYFSRTRLGVDAELDLILTLKKGKKSGDSEILDARDFNIDFSSIRPEVNYRPLGNLRFIVKYEFQNKDLLQNVDNLKSNDFSFESTWRIAKKTSWNAGLSFIDVNYIGETNTFSAFELLEGLKPGNNFLWNTSLTKRLANNVDLIINYEGRKTGENNPIHTGRAQVKATF